MLIVDITGEQLRRGREYLGISRWKLATECGVNRTSLKVYELYGSDPVSAQTDVLRRLTRYLQDRGIVFEDDGSVELIEHAQPTMKVAVLNHRQAAAP